MIDNLSSSSDSEGPSKKRKSVEREDAPKAEADAKSSDPAAPQSTSSAVKFSDDSDDDFASATNATANASKTFDDLLKEDKKDKSGDDDDSDDDLDIDRFRIDAKEVSKEAEKDGEEPK